MRSVQIQSLRENTDDKKLRIWTHFTQCKGYSASSIFLGQPGIYQFTFLSFHIIPDRFRWCLPGGKTNHPRKFWTILHFLAKSDSPHRDTETGCSWQNLSEIYRQIFHFSNHFGDCFQNQYQLYNQIKSTFILPQVFSICYRYHNLSYLNNKSYLTKKRHLIEIVNVVSNRVISVSK